MNEDDVVRQGSVGPSTDKNNDPVIDPTSNVLQLVAAAVQRLDDLRISEANNIRELAALREQHAKDLREAEASRIDAIRAVDVAALQQASLVATAQAATLATQVVTSAEALRNQVIATANASQIALAAALDPVQKDIADLRRAQYEAQGQKTQVVESQQSTSAIYALVGLIITVILATITIAGVVLANGS